VAETRRAALLIARYGLAGLVNSAVGLAIISGLDLGLHVAPPLANAAGYACGIAIGYGLNRRFVFRSQTPDRHTAPRYLGAVAGAFLLNQAVLAVTLAALGRGAPQDAAAQALAVVSYSAGLFLACRFWVFRSPVHPKE
jgi:putative flippase GtrA